MRPVSLMFKTVSDRCNLGCSYCYYRGTNETGSHVMSPALLEKVISQYMEMTAGQGASFGWQGGEPTLAGLSTFEEIVALQAHHARSGTVISNEIQTNGTLLDKHWAEFFARYNFLVGISLDGPREVHDSVRLDAEGNGTFDTVVKGTELLFQEGVEVNALGVVGHHNVNMGSKLLPFYEEIGFTHVQLVPQMSFRATQPTSEPKYGVGREEYGQFLAELFDSWWQNGFPRTSVGMFDALIGAALGRHGDLCVFAKECDGALIVETDGSVYPCDFFIDDRHCLGNLERDSLHSIVTGENRSAFSKRKSRFSHDCSSCQWLDLCRGGCRRNRGQGDTDVLCESYKMLFSHGGERIRQIADRMKRLAVTRSSSGKLNRNEPCPCGSSKKYKACCGDPRIQGSYVFS